jgi:hypothetical protein
MQSSDKRAAGIETTTLVAMYVVVIAFIGLSLAACNELRVFAPRSRRKRPVGPTRARGLLVCRTYGNFTRSWLMVG